MTTGAAPAGAKVVLGLDVGTTAAKVSAFALGGGWRGGAANEYPLQQPQPGWEVQDPEVMWRALREGLAEVAALLGEASVVGIGVSTAMHGLIGLDAEHRAITPLLTWADSRAAEQAMALRGTELDAGCTTPRARPCTRCLTSPNCSGTASTSPTCWPRRGGGWG